MSVTGDERRLSLPALKEHWETGVPVLIRLGGEPELRLLIDKPAGRLTLRAPMDEIAVIPPNRLANVTAAAVFDGGRRYLEIATMGEELVADGYSMLMMIADRIQLDGAGPLAAFEETLDLWESILSARARLGVEAEVGLFGELLLTEALLASGAAGPEAWRGGLREEHDFGFGEIDVEVKTTAGEHRVHRIHGLGQLLPTAGGALWLLSVQITRGGDDQGRTLSELVDDVLDQAGPEGHERVLANLAGVRWNETQRDLYKDRWRLRTVPLPLRVENDFPRITPSLLTGLPVDTSKIREVDYDIDVSSFAASSGPPPELVAALDLMGAGIGS